MGAPRLGHQAGEGQINLTAFGGYAACLGKLARGAATVGRFELWVQSLSVRICRELVLYIFVDDF